MEIKERTPRRRFASFQMATSSLLAVSALS